MWMSLELGPEHVIHETPVAKHLRQETGLPNWITYLHSDYGHWIAALRSRDPRFIVEIGYVCDADPKSPHPTREDIARLKRDVSVFVPKSEYRKASVARAREYARAREEDDAIFKSGVEGVYRHLYRKHGPMKAEEYIRNTGMTPPAGLRMAV